MLRSNRTILPCIVLAFAAAACSESGTTPPRGAEAVFDLLERPDAVRHIQVPAALSYRGTLESLYDGDPATGVAFDLVPDEPGSALPFLEITLNEPAATSEVSIELLTDGAATGDATLLARGEIRIAGGQPLRSQTDAQEAPTLARRITFLRPAPEVVGAPPTDRLLFVAAAAEDSADPDAAETVTVHVAEINVFTAPDLESLGQLASQPFDTHFHPCSFSHLCTSPEEIATEQERYAIASAFVFGLQHNLARGASPWAHAAGDPEHARDHVPFHYNDPSARPGAADGAVPGVDRVNEQRERSGLPLVDGYAGWPVFPTSLADWHILSAHAAAPQGVRQRLYPFVSSLRLEHATDDGPAYGVCTVNPATGRTWNEDLLRAFDTLFPGAVHGYAEYNLNKVVLFSHGAPAPAVDDAWLRCMQPVMDYLARSGRPIGFHLDLASDGRGANAFATLQRVAEAFPRTPMIWHHGGISPEVADTLSAEEHLGQLRAFLATSPGARYLDLSWSKGFFLRLDPARLGDRELVAGAERRRDWPADLAAYLQFFNEHADSLLFGSDQVGLHFPATRARDLEGRPFVDHAGYLQGQTYGGALREEIGLLGRAQEHAAGGVTLTPETLEKLFAGNARRLVDGVRHPTETGMNLAQARTVLRQLLQLQHRDNRALGGTSAPAEEEFLPAALR